MFNLLATAWSSAKSRSGRRTAAARRAQASLHRAAGVTIQTLEERRLLSVSLSDGVLNVVGTTGNDNIVVSLLKTDTSKLTVTGAGISGDYSAADINLIQIQGLTGSDRIDIDQSNGAITINTFISGGRGADTLEGGSGQNVIYGGKGPDLIVGNGAADSLVGGKGNDKIIGSATNGGRDTIDAGVGSNLISDDNSGDSIVNAGAGNNLVNSGLAQFLTTNTITANAQANVQNNAVVGYTPQMIRVAYGLGPLSQSAYTNRGQGETIAIVDAFDDPNAMADLSFFSRTFGLPAPTADTFQKLYQGGTQPLVDAGWAQEISLDIEWAHAIAPEAKILLCEAQTNADADLTATAALAAQTLKSEPGGGGVVSMSFGGPESGVINGTNNDLVDDLTYDNAAYASTTSFIAASGDIAGLVGFPAESPFVTDVGGTTLPLNPDGTRIATQPESAWASGGGGISATEPRPGFQDNITVGGVAYLARIGPDVAMDADPATGVAVYDSTPDPFGNTGWQQIGGTSLSCPMFAGIVTLANQIRTSNGLQVIGSNLNNAIYTIGEQNQNQYFNDITTGSNASALGGGPALAGFDLATGFGSPKAASFIIGIASQDIGQFPSSNFVDTNIKFSATYTNNYEITTTNPPVNQDQFASFLGTGTALGFNNIAFNIPPLNADSFDQFNSTGATFTVLSATVNPNTGALQGAAIFAFTYLPTNTIYSLPVIITGTVVNGKIRATFSNFSLIQYGGGVYLGSGPGATNNILGLLQGNISN